MLKRLLPIITFVLLFPAATFASMTTGTIDGASTYAWGENLGWLFPLCDGCNLQVTDTGVSGYFWSRENGWLNLSPANAGIANDGSGNLSGYAWSSELGWINFVGVSINSSGKFIGTAGTSGAKIGRISFDCTACSIVTDWRPASVRNAVATSTPPATNPVGGGGGGGSITPPTQVPVVTPDDKVTPTIEEQKTPEEIKAFTEEAKAADILHDGRIDLLDIKALFSNWGKQESGNLADCNRDGKVDILDFNLLMVHWSK